MKQKKRVGMRLLILMLVVSLLISACNGSNGNTSNDSKGATDNKTSTSEEVTLKMLLIGSKPADYDLVFNEVNQLLNEKINTTIETEFLDWSDWSSKYPLKFAARDDFDLVFTANWAFYHNQAMNGGFYELTDEMIQSHAPLTWKAMPEVSWEQAKIKGKQYMVPNNNQEITDKVVMIREDLRKKHNLEPVTNAETFAAYTKGIAQNEPGMSGFATAAGGGYKWHELDNMLLEQQNEWKLVDPNMPFAFKLDDPAGKVFNVYDTPEFKELLVYYKDLADSRVWSKNVVNSKNEVWQDVKAGKAASLKGNLGSLGFQFVEAQRDLPNVEMSIVDLTPDQKKTASISTQNGMAVHATSEHVERALMVIDLLQNDKQIHDLTMYGIPGIHYEPLEEDKYKPGPDRDKYAGFSNWGWNSPLNRTEVSYPPEAMEIEKAWEEKIFNYPLETFVFDDQKVKTELANIGNIMIRYGVPLEYGLVADPQKGQAELISQLNTAGIDSVQAELQSQIDAFLENN
ncbi:ABC transporter substrate-binding protein [Paenibacillus silvae]|uniref:ABC transporter substrate-binding protein n=1 Tax=Paenibacillus silvae TaxID=1325358 RepID=UPI0025A22668|nr:ABC transporter substrate-binding protein [Paenibacillus silvae]MDM5277429.1 ABC transporter substrate-binding protein [Paenibacillus silvae]